MQRPVRVRRIIVASSIYTRKLKQNSPSKSCHFMPIHAKETFRSHPALVGRVFGIVNRVIAGLRSGRPGIQPLPYRDKTTHRVFEPLGLISLLAALVPSPSLGLTRIHLF